ncbi:MAG: hypothetical protein NWE96_04360 [Candidatus Bathyarchaeota archaeon]|nr:hypothetical protein [Candidatus Bathyarchaeota archaeon]
MEILHTADMVKVVKTIDVAKTLNTHTTSKLLEKLLVQRRKEVNTRNVVLKIETYNRLDRYKVRLISEKGNSKLTFDDVLNDLLDNIKA